MNAYFINIILFVNLNVDTYSEAIYNNMNS